MIMGFIKSLFGNKKSSSGISVDIALVSIRPGKFLMGSPSSEKGRLDDEIQHEVTLSRGFKMGKYPVTQREWEAVMGTNPAYFSDASPDTPVDSVSWDDCMEFLHNLSKMTGKHWRMPTEAEWEYACRAGTVSALNSGKDLTDDYECPNMNEVGWYGRNSNKTLHPVGQKEPNVWGLYDMHGSLYEWCSDGYSPYADKAVTDPNISAADSKGVFVLRGGCWLIGARGCRSANRGFGHSEDRHEIYGLRVAVDLDEE
jgi:eukaryotic-like serine/threonine-protein kinase